MQKLCRLLLSLKSAASCQVIIFSFSKKECEALALQMVSLDLNDEEEAKMVSAIFSNAIDCLSEEDRRLPQVPPYTPNPNVLTARLHTLITTMTYHYHHAQGDITAGRVCARSSVRPEWLTGCTWCTYRSTQSCRCCGAASASTTRGCCPS